MTPRPRGWPAQTIVTLAYASRQPRGKIISMLEPVSPAKLLLSDHSGQREVELTRTPFTIGRQTDSDLVLPFAYVSRQHARIEHNNNGFLLVDQASRCGSYVNGERVERHPLSINDVMHFGSLEGPQLRFRPPETTVSVPLRALLGHLQSDESSESSLTKLSWFVEAARRLNQFGGMNEILSALIETTLVLTRVERGYVFLRDDAGTLSVATGRNRNGDPLSDDSTLSNSAIRRAIASGSEFIITDTLSDEADAPSHSVVAQSLRTIICIPLRKRSARRKGRGFEEPDTLGVLYLDSRQPRSKLLGIDADLLNMVASEAAILVENATLAQAEEEGRRAREELKIASEIQQKLMAVRIPELSFAKVHARCLPCKDIGGDFYDAIAVDGALYVVVADVSGKGVSAALLGSTLQGLIYAQVLARQPLAQIALFANRYICHKNIGKYATLVLLRLAPDGSLEYVNCGHVQPLLHRFDSVSALPNQNFPVGLLAEATYESNTLIMGRGERILIVTDGVTEAETAAGDHFGDERLRTLFQTGAEVPAVLAEIESFTGGAPPSDDCTILEICYGI